MNIPLYNIYKQISNGTFHQYGKLIVDSFFTNYKTWFLYLACSFYLCDFQWLQACISFFYAYYVCYIGHQSMHWDVFYCNIFSISHHRHHFQQDTFSYFSNCLVEFVSLATHIIVQYVWSEFELSSLFFIHPWIILFLYFIYTTVHNINYGIFKVNDYHYYHHENMHTNIGPDFYDAIFGTKHKQTPLNECIDHYIPNIIGSFIVVSCLKYTYNYLLVPDIWNTFFIGIYISCVVFLILSNIWFFQKEVENTVKKDWEHFLEV